MADPATVDMEVEADGAPATAAESVEGALRQLQLRKIIKENHGSAIETLVAHPEAGRRHMLATAGGGLVSIYDNDHCGGHLDLSCILSNEPSEFSKGGPVTELAWVRTGDLFENEAVLAFAGTAGEVGIISVAQTRVVGLLTGHSGPVRDLCAHPTRLGVIASCSAEDGSVRLWDALAELRAKDSDDDVADALLVTIPIGRAPRSLAIRPDGSHIAVGFADGGIVELPLVQEDGQLVAGAEAGAAAAAAARVIAPPAKGALARSAAVDCLAYAGADRLVSHDIGGRLKLWECAEVALVKTLTVPKGDSANSANNANAKKTQARTRFGLTADGRYVCCGNPSGQVFLFDLDSGERINKLSMPRIKGFVTAAVFVSDDRNLALCTNDAILWRWDVPVAVPEPSGQAALVAGPAVAATSAA